METAEMTAVGPPPFERLCVIGLGLIGSSLARAARDCGAAGRVVGYDRDRDVRARAQALGFLDATTESAAAAAADADLVVLCTPVGVMAAAAAEVAPALAPGAVVSDVGSVKTSVTASVLAALEGCDARFIPAHPVAGTEQSGPEAGFATLFRDRWCIFTPPEGADPQAVARLRAFWERLGSWVEIMSAEHHDRVLAITSHLPHLIAYTIVGTASDLEEVTESEVMKFSAGGFRDFTRIAASDPTMWRDVFLNNREATLELLGRFTEDLIALQRAIRWGDGALLFDRFERTRAIRRGILDLGQDTDAPDFGRPRELAADQDMPAQRGMGRIADGGDDGDGGES